MTGPLAFLPLHAAGLYDKADGPRVFRHVVSSYTPTLTALVEASQRPSAPSARILAISQPNTPHHSPLQSTVTEIEALKQHVGERDFKWLNAEEATVEAVLGEMSNCSWCHLACHGIQRSDDPLKSSFALHDGYLDLATIMSKRFSSAEVAFLSACQTATGDERRPEEAIHLAAGTLMAGFRTVFGTMWSIGDEDAPVIAEQVYAYMLKASDGGDRVGGEQAAYALHRAVGRLREGVGEEQFIRWVPFIHLGV